MQSLVFRCFQGPRTGTVLGGVGPVVGRRGQHPPHCRILHRAPTKSCSRQKSYNTCLNNLGCLSCKYISWPTQTHDLGAISTRLEPANLREQLTFTPCQPLARQQLSPRQLGNLLLHMGREALRHVSCDSPCRWYPIWQ